jgi:hypothetical protein
MKDTRPAFLSWLGWDIRSELVSFRFKMVIRLFSMEIAADAFVVERFLLLYCYPGPPSDPSNLPPP